MRSGRGLVIAAVASSAVIALGVEACSSDASPAGRSEGAPMCGSVACDSNQYCSLNFVMQADGGYASHPGSCQDIPAACGEEDADTLCYCLQTADPACQATTTEITSECATVPGGYDFGCHPVTSP